MGVAPFIFQLIYTISTTASQPNSSRSSILGKTVIGSNRKPAAEGQRCDRKASDLTLLGFMVGKWGNSPVNLRHDVYVDV